MLLLELDNGLKGILIDVDVWSIPVCDMVGIKIESKSTGSIKKNNQQAAAIGASVTTTNKLTFI